MVWPDRRREIPASPHGEVWCFGDAQIEQSLLDHIERVFAIEVEHLAGADLVAENGNTPSHAAGDVIAYPGLARAAFCTDQRDTPLRNHVQIGRTSCRERVKIS